MMKRVFTILLTMSMTASMLSGCGNESASESSTEQEVISEEDVATTAEVKETKGTVNKFDLASGNEAFVYVPCGDGIDVGHNATWKPIILVYNSKKVTADDVETLAKECGFGQIAADEQCVIMFVNPKGDSWTEEDKDSLLAAVGSKAYETAAYSDGTLISYDGTTGLNENGQLPGYTERLYVFADGSGADFVSQYILPGIDDTVHFMDGFYKPAAAYLSNVTVVPEKINSYLDSTEMPVYLVNANDDVKAFYKGVASASHINTVESTVTDGFDVGIVDGWTSLVSKVRRCYDVVIDIHDYETNFQNDNQIFKASTGSELEYYLWTPNSVADKKDGSVPLVVAMHGNDNSALTMANITEWPTLAEENGFIYMGFNHCEPYTDDEYIECIQSVIDSNPGIDTSRIYMTGFSIGSIHTWNLISNEKYKNFFAAAAPTNAMCTIEEYRGDATDPTAMGTGTIMPIIYFGGTGSHIREMPNQPWFMMEITDPIPTISYILARNEVTDSYKNDESAGFWGIKADSEEEFTSKYYNNENNKLVKDVVSSYKSKDGNVYTQFVAVSSTHEYEDINTELAWNFMSQFSRNEDGSININK